MSLVGKTVVDLAVSPDKEVPDLASEISYESFTKIDIRVGTVTKADRVNKSLKLLKLEVFFGDKLGSRQILAGIGESYMPESILGRRVLAVLNLVPRKLMGLESQGMILAAKSASGLSVLLGDCPGAPDGAQLG